MICGVELEFIRLKEGIVEPPLVATNPEILVGIVTEFHVITAPEVGELIVTDELLFCEQIV